MNNERTTTATDATTALTLVNRPGAKEHIVASIGDLMDPEQFIAQVFVAFQDEKIKPCTPHSKFKALQELAAMGLLPTLGQVVLIPYKNRDEGTIEVKAMPQWQGYKALMERHPAILEVTGHLVHINDEFTMENGELRHSYDPFDSERTINAIRDLQGGYCKIVYRDGRPPKYHMVTARQIEKARKCAKTQDIWNAWYEQMALKTLYRDCYARRAVPMDPLVNARVEKVLRLDDVNLGNDPLRVNSETTTRNLDQARKQREGETAPPPAPKPESQEQPPEETATEGTDPPAPDDADQSELDPVIPETYRAMLAEAKGADALRYIAQKAEADKRISDKAITAIVAACGMER
jgi:recombination protein RecT